MATKFSEQMQKKMSDSQPYSGSRKNVLINGNMDIWQRGTSFTGVTSSQWGADRFIFINTGTSATFTVNRGTSIPSGTIGYSFRVTPTVADTSIATTDQINVRTRIEGYDIVPYLGKVCTISFWVRNTLTGTHYIALQNYGADLSYVMPYTINASDTWEFKSLTFTMHAGTSGSWNFTNDFGLSIFWNLAAGSTHQTSSIESWVSGSYKAGTSVQNFANNVANLFMIKHPQLELGPVATDFDYRHFSKELTLCQRFFEKSYGVDVDPASATTGGADRLRVGYFSSTTNVWAINIRYKVPKGSIPSSVTFYSPNTGTSGYAYDNQATQGDVVASLSAQGTTGCTCSGSTNGSKTFTDILVHWTASAEI